jgi:hypothetical protein
VIGEQQRAQVRPGALRVGTADHNKLFAVEVLDLQPRAAAIAGPIGRVDALRHHAVRLDLACMSKELAALPNDVIAVLQPEWRGSLLGRLSKRSYTRHTVATRFSA